MQLGGEGGESVGYDPIIGTRCSGRGERGAVRSRDVPGGDFRARLARRADGDGEIPQGAREHRRDQSLRPEGGDDGVDSPRPFHGVALHGAVPLAGSAPEPWEFLARAVKRDVEIGVPSDVVQVIVRG